MRRLLRRTSIADRDLAQIIDWLDGDRTGTAARFVDCVEASFRLISEAPEIGSLCDFDDPRLEGLRVWRVQRFHNYLIDYRVHRDAVQVVRVLHSTRDIPRALSE